VKIIQITPGTGNFHCGSCLRDHGLVQALRDAGHDVTMVPLYLPLVLDDQPEDDVPIFYGGINVYLQQKATLFRRTPRWLDALLDRPQLLRLASRRAGMTSAADLGELSLSTLQGRDGRQAKELSRLLDWLADAEQPDLVCISNGLLSGLGEAIADRLRVPVICTLQGEDSFLDTLPEPYRTRCWQVMSEAVAACAGVIAISRYYGDLMAARLSLPDGHVRVVHNGIDTHDAVVRTALPTPPVIGYLTRLIDGKGLGALVDAFIALAASERVPGVRLHLAGGCTPADEPYVGQQRAKLAAAGLTDRTRWLPNVSRADKLQFLSELTVLSVPAMYGEAFGLYVLEALAAGVPVVQPDHAAFPELIAATGGGVLYDPAQPEALVDALAELLTDADRNIALGNAGRAAVSERFTTTAMAANIAAVYEQLAAPPGEADDGAG
jgi:glycosyltransferase involved in cell wall biosynthesis